MSCHVMRKPFYIHVLRKMVKISCAVIVQLIIAIIFYPYSGLQIIYYILYFSLNQAGGVPCSLTNSTGKFDSNPKRMLRALKRTVSMRRFF